MIAIRKCTDEDLSTVHEIQMDTEKRGDLWGYKADSMADLQKQDKDWFWVAVENAMIIGYAFCGEYMNQGECIFESDDRVLEVIDLGVRVECWGKGVASELLTAIESQAKARSYDKIIVYTSAKRFDDILRFYRRNGFKTWWAQMFKDLGSSQSVKSV